MEFLNKNRNPEDLSILGKICFDTLSQPFLVKPRSDEFYGVYIDGRDRDIDYIEDLAAIKSFRLYSEYQYPILLLTPRAERYLTFFDKFPELRFTIYPIPIPILDSHDKYSEFCIKQIWNYIPKEAKRLLYFQSDGFLIKKGWEEFVLNNKIDYIGSSWCHTPSIDILTHEVIWKNLGFPKITCGNGGFSYRNRDCCERISNEYSQFKLRESDGPDNRIPEDVFYSHLINGVFGGGIVGNIPQCMKFSLDPITLSEYNNKESFGFHYPKKVNEFQQVRDYFKRL